MDYSRCCLVFGITPNLAFALGTFIVGYRAQHPVWNGDIHVFHSGLSDEQVASLHKVWPRISFQRVDEASIGARLTGAGQLGTAVSRTVARYSTMYFAKFEMFDLLQKYEKCIWFDVDMVVLRALDEVWDFDDLAWRPVLKRTQAKHADLRAAYANVLEAHPVPRPNGGLICASGGLWHDRRINAQSLYDLFSEIISRKPIVTGDEMSLMLMAARHKLRVRVLPMIYNCPSGSAESDRALLVHSIGRAKFWNDGAVSAAFPVWRDYYAQWLASGGEAYSGAVDESFLPLGSQRIISAARASKQRRISLQLVKGLVPALLCPDPFRDSGGQQWFYLSGCPARYRVGLVPEAADEEAGKDAAMTVDFVIENAAGRSDQLQALLATSEFELRGFSLSAPGPRGRLVVTGAGIRASRLRGIAVRLAAIAGRLESGDGG